MRCEMWFQYDNVFSNIKITNKKKSHFQQSLQQVLSAGEKSHLREVWDWGLLAAFVLKRASCTHTEWPRSEAGPGFLLPQANLC